MDCNDDYQPQAPPVQTNFIPKATESPSLNSLAPYVHLVA